MNVSGESNQVELERLASYLEQDPKNQLLLIDTVNAALQANQPARALELIDGYQAKNGESGPSDLNGSTDLSGPIHNLAGLAALQSSDYQRAYDAFEHLYRSNPDSSGLRYNLAFSLSRLEKVDQALGFLDDALTHSLAQAGVLKVQLLHFQGQFEEAMLEAKRLLDIHSDDAALLGVASVLAMDLEDVQFAKLCAQKSLDAYKAAGSGKLANSDALTTIGFLELDGGDHLAAQAMFEDALLSSPHAPRAWIGKGLSQVSIGNYAEAAQNMTKGAQLFGSHLGSWIGAGWAHVLDKNLIAARGIFEHALGLDPNFSESHGSLGVVEFMEGRTDLAKALAARALRLDRESFSGALAMTMILSQSGKQESAAAIFDRAMSTPLDASGRTLLDAVTRLGVGRQ